MSDIEQVKALIKQLEGKEANTSEPEVTKTKLDMCKITLVEPKTYVERYFCANNEQVLIDNMLLIKEYCEHYGDWLATSIVDTLQHKGISLQFGIFEQYEHYRTIDTLELSAQ